MRRWESFTCTAAIPWTIARHREFLRLPDNQPLLITMYPGSLPEVPEVELCRALAEDLGRRNGAVAVLAGGELVPPIWALLASADIGLLCTDAHLDLDRFDNDHLTLAAALIGARMPKVKALDFYLRRRHDACSLKNSGFAGEIFPADHTSAQVHAFLDRIEPVAVVALKRAGRLAIADSDTALAAERLIFASCFENGAPAGIAAWLRSRFNTSA